MEDQRTRWDRREDDRRTADRRGLADPRERERRQAERREDSCPSCGGALTPAAYCPACKARLIRIRPFRDRRAVGA